RRTIDRTVPRNRRGIPDALGPAGTAILRPRSGTCRTKESGPTTDRHDAGSGHADGTGSLVGVARLPGRAGVALARGDARARRAQLQRSRRAEVRADRATRPDARTLTRGGRSRWAPALHCARLLPLSRAPRLRRRVALGLPDLQRARHGDRAGADCHPGSYLGGRRHDLRSAAAWTWHPQPLSPSLDARCSLERAGKGAGLMRAHLEGGAAYVARSRLAPMESLYGR